MTDLSPPRGSRDFLPQEKILRNSIVDTLRKTFEKYGFNPLETPALENFDVLSSKYAGGDEILKETYSLEDQGKRKLGLRYDLTVPLSRVFASQKLALPFKRYQIASVWRDGPIKAGRYREFTQCDVDVIGVASPKQEAELMALTRDSFKALGLKAVVKVNSRKLLNGLLDFAGVPESKRIAAILELDKLEKAGNPGVLAELEKLLGKSEAKTVLELFVEVEREKSLRVIEGMGLGKEGAEGIKELNEFFESRIVLAFPRAGVELLYRNGFRSLSGCRRGQRDQILAGRRRALRRHDRKVRFLQGKDSCRRNFFRFGRDFRNIEGKKR